MLKNNLGIATIAFALSAQPLLASDKAPNIRVDGIVYEALGSGYYNQKICIDNIDGRIYHVPAYADVTLRRDSKRITLPISPDDHFLMLRSGYLGIPLDASKRQVTELDLASQKPEPKEIFSNDLTKSPYRQLFEYQGNTFKTCRDRA